MTQTRHDGESPTRRLTILGVHLCADAYPNTKFVLDHLRQDRTVRLTEINRPVFRDRPLTYAKSAITTKFFKGLFAFVRAVYCHADVFVRYWLRETDDVVYSPYPALGILTVFSFLPVRLRPKRLIADAFISIYDTVVSDRELLAPDTLIARILLAAERRAYRTATYIIVDTEDNRVYYARRFGLPVEKFAVVPLATDENVFESSTYTGRVESCHVVFVGTFVPLQGTDVIAQTIRILRNREDIHFTIIGTGQAAESFAKIVGDAPPDNFTWIQGWQDPVTVAKYIESADICLGIFSAGPKAERVWPYKNYAYMTVGRAIITADTACARRMLSAAGSVPFATVRPGDPQALAEKIMQLADAPSDRTRLARNARRYYDEKLANSMVISRLTNEIVFADAPRGTSSL